MKLAIDKCVFYQMEQKLILIYIKVFLKVFENWNLDAIICLLKFIFYTKFYLHVNCDN